MVENWENPFGLAGIIHRPPGIRDENLNSIPGKIPTTQFQGFGDFFGSIPRFFLFLGSTGKIHPLEGIPEGIPWILMDSALNWNSVMIQRGGKSGFFRDLAVEKLGIFRNAQIPDVLSQMNPKKRGNFFRIWEPPPFDGSRLIPGKKTFPGGGSGLGFLVESA